MGLEFTTNRLWDRGTSHGAKPIVYLIKNVAFLRTPILQLSNKSSQFKQSLSGAY